MTDIHFFELWRKDINCEEIYEKLKIYRKFYERSLIKKTGTYARSYNTAQRMQRQEQATDAAILLIKCNTGTPFIRVH